MKNNPLISKNNSLHYHFKAGMLFGYFKSVTEPVKFFESKLAPELNTKPDVEPAYRRELGLGMKG